MKPGTQAATHIAILDLWEGSSMSLLLKAVWRTMIEINSMLKSTDCAENWPIQALAMQEALTEPLFVSKLM